MDLSTFNSWKEVLQDIAQDLILGSLLFNVYANDLFFALADVGICNLQNGVLVLYQLFVT